MKCPYSKIQLQIALYAVERKFLDYEKTHGEGAAEQVMAENFSKNSVGNKEAAEYHGISLETLINSPNYSVLCSSYAASQYHKVMEFLKAEFGLTDKEAWAALAADQLGE